MDLRHPEGTSDLYKHLGVDSHGGHDAHAAALPVHDDNHTDDRASHDHHDEPFLSYEPEENAYVFNLSKILKNIFPYAFVFAAAAAAFVLFFTHTSLNSFFSSLKSAKPVQTKIVLSQSQLAAYNAWISSYYYDVNDASALDPNNDLSGNGLTNYQKFLLGLNPKKKDTLGLGMTDTQALIQGINPLTGQPMTDQQKQFIAANVDLEAVSNRLSLAVAQSTPKVAGANTAQPGRDSVTIDQKVNGEVDIPSLKISAPLVWTQDTKNFEDDLTSGVVHYPGTAMPGQVGTAYISGHSSNYAWIKSRYNDIFAKLGDLKQFDSFTITATDTNGKKAIFHYTVTDSGIYKADDQAQFARADGSIVALSTCWPVGTSDKRLVVFGQLTQTER